MTFLFNCTLVIIKKRFCTLLIKILKGKKNRTVSSKETSRERLFPEDVAVAAVAAVTELSEEKRLFSALGSVFACVSRRGVDDNHDDFPDRLSE